MTVDLLEAARNFEDELYLLEHPGHPDQSVHSPVKRAGGAIRSGAQKAGRGAKAAAKVALGVHPKQNAERKEAWGNLAKRGKKAGRVAKAAGRGVAGVMRAMGDSATADARAQKKNRSN